MIVRKTTVHGLRGLLSRLNKLPHEVAHAAGDALMVEGEETIAESKPLVPVDLGNLRSSGFVELPAPKGTTITVLLGYGGPAGSGNQGASNAEEVGYAVYVHEDLLAHHPVGQAKYLEVVLDRRRQGLVDRLARRARRSAAFRGG